MKVQVLQVPYDSGNRSIRMGSGPEHFVGNGLVKVLEADGHRVSVESVEPKDGFRAEIRTQFELYARLAERVACARRDGNFPLILSGNCGATLGAIGGAGTVRPGVIWFDAHGDFNTPETTTSGFLDGMGLAIVAGLCWHRLAASIPGFNPVRGANILHVGARDFDPEERAMFERVGATVVDAAAINRRGVREALQAPLSKLGCDVEEAHLHIDLDVLNPKEAPANEYVTEEGGLSVVHLDEAIRCIKEILKITSASVAAFDPKYDPQGKTLRAGLTLMRQILGSE
jgi:arginase